MGLDLVLRFDSDNLDGCSLPCPEDERRSDLRKERGGFGMGRVIGAMKAWRLVVVCGLALASGTARAHPGEEDAIRLVLLEWANGIANDDAVGIGRLLSPDFEHASRFSGPAGHDRYLALVAAGEAPMQTIDLRHARYAIEGDRAKVGEILGVVMQTTAVAAEVSLARSQGEWRIERITGAGGAPRVRPARRARALDPRARRASSRRCVRWLADRDAHPRRGRAGPILGAGRSFPRDRDGLARVGGQGRSGRRTDLGLRSR
jgi:hypothetical protein